MCAARCWRSVLARDIYVAAVCWGSSISARDASKGGHSYWTETGGVWVSEEQEITEQTWTILPTLSMTHSRDSGAHSPLIQLKERFKKSFSLFTIRLFNSSPLGLRWNSLHILHSVCTYSFRFIIDLHKKNSFITTLFCEYIFILIIFILCIYLFGSSSIFVDYNNLIMCISTYRVNKALWFDLKFTTEAISEHFDFPRPLLQLPFVNLGVCQKSTMQSCLVILIYCNSFILDFVAFIPFSTSPYRT